MVWKDRVADCAPRDKVYPPFVPLAPPWYPNQTTKARGRANSDRKQSKEEHKQINIYGDMALFGGWIDSIGNCAQRNELYPLLAPLSPHWHPNQPTKARGRANSDRKQSTEERKQSNIHTENELYPPLAPLAPHWHPNQPTKTRIKANSDRKQSKE